MITFDVFIDLSYTTRETRQCTYKREYIRVHRICICARARANLSTIL